MSEIVSTAGSGLTFENYYGAGVTEAFRGAILTAEHELQSHFVDPVHVVMSFDLQAMNPSFSARNEFNIVQVSYSDYVAALTAHATTADDLTAVAGMPVVDPTHGDGITLTAPQARVLGLAVQTNSIDNAVVLNSAMAFNFGRDAVGVLEHEITEGVFGRVSGLGQDGEPWHPMDLFRFDAAGGHDYTGGADGVSTFFGIDAAHVTNFQFHSAIDASGHSDGFDLADWDNTVGDSFGPGGPGSPNALSATDLQVLDVLGWTPASAHAASTGGATGASPVSPGGTAGSTIAANGGLTDVQGTAGADTITGAAVDDHLRGGDGDDVINGGPAFDDINGNQGNDTAHGNAGDDWVVGGRGDDLLFGDAGADLVLGNLGNDTLDGGDGDDIVRGGQGDDSLSGGAGDDFISGDRGNDTVAGGAGADRFHFSQDAGIDKVLDFNSAEGDRVVLDPGVTYTLHQEGVDTVLDAGAGNEMILVGVQLSALPAGWIVGG